MSTALTPYRPPPSSSSSTTLIPRPLSSLLTPQIGHALATELLYRLLFDLLNRLLASIHRFAAHQLDTFTSYLERRYVEREAARREALERAKESVQKPGIREEVERVAVRRGFLRLDGRKGGWEEGGRVNDDDEEYVHSPCPQSQSSLQGSL